MAIQHFRFVEGKNSHSLPPRTTTQGMPLEWLGSWSLVKSMPRLQPRPSTVCRDFGIDSSSYLTACAAGKKMDEIIGEQFIMGLLTDEYNLDLSVQLQLPLLILMTAYMSSRPGVLIESGCVRGSNDALQYRDVVLCVIPNPEDLECHILVMEVTLMFMKGKRNKSQLYIPFGPLLAWSGASLGSFEAQGINSLEDIFCIEVPPYRNSLQLRWRSEMLNIPVFRRTYHTAYGVRVSPDRALLYDVFNQYLQRLGRNAGLEEPLTPYCIRRGTANAVDDVATTAERNQVLGHSRADIFERYYLSQKVKHDVQSAYLGHPARESVIRAVGMMSLTWDPRVPKELTNEQKAAIEHNPILVELNRQKQDLVSDMRYQYGSVPKAQGTDLHAQHGKLERTIQSERRFLRKRAQDNIREEFFAKIDTIEIEHQLLGLSPTNDLKVKEPIVQFTCVERARLARSLFRSLSSSVEEKHTLHPLRIQVICDWTALCSLQGVPYKQRNLLSELVGLKEANLVDGDMTPTICPATQCLFCLGNEQKASNSRPYSFSRPDKLRRHVYDCHLRYLAPDACFPCPHPTCSENLWGITHFKDHAALIHKVYL
ncbi:FluG protein [Histoplasma capsulatum H143]|uniref:FluG protein n=1 Tax=Ajellomyces capsulatus (strain H143) TaxID=544712 RepID=C6HA66_AJECH|nr:FluG protein [Histoplasma capsulatum H143]